MFSNRKARRLGENIGIELERVPLVNYIHPDDRSLIVDRHRRRLDGEKPPNNYAFRLVGQDGQEMSEDGTLYVQTDNVDLDKNFVSAYGVRPGPRDLSPE